MLDTYLGIDVHKKLCVYTELDSRGNVVSRGKFGNNISEVSDFSARAGILSCSEYIQVRNLSIACRHSAPAHRSNYLLNLK